MSEIIVLVFENETGAIQMRDKLLELQQQDHISLTDAAIVVRDKKGKPKIKQLKNLTGKNALGGAFWGLFIGVLILAPWLGMAAGAAAGALKSKFYDIGVDDKFIKEVGSTIEPGQSALFLLVAKVDRGKVLPEIAPYKAKVLQTSLSKEDEARLRELFGASDIKE